MYIHDCTCHIQRMYLAGDNCRLVPFPGSIPVSSRRTDRAAADIEEFVPDGDVDSFLEEEEGGGDVVDGGGSEEER